MKKVVIHTDGGCHGNPGPGGWGVTLSFGNHYREMRGGEPATTNNRMELRAAIEALNALKESCEVDLFTDSEYVKNGVESWIRVWKVNGWRTKEKKPVKNEDLWRELDSAASRHRVCWNWLKGHVGHEGNERCDRLANEAIEQIKRTYTKEQLKGALEEFESDANGGQPQQKLAL